jgi:hypothetical protein
LLVASAAAVTALALLAFAWFVVSLRLISPSLTY